MPEKETMERAKEDLPRYAEILRKHHVDLLLITTGIVSVKSPHALDILTTAKGVTNAAAPLRPGLFSGSVRARPLPGGSA